MPQKRKRQAGTSSKKTRSAAKNKLSGSSVSRRDARDKPARRAVHWKQFTPEQQEQQRGSFEYLRLRRQALTRKQAEVQSGITQRVSEHFHPRAFFRDKRGRRQVRAYDDYTRHVKVQTATPGKLKSLTVRGNHEASLIGIWNNAVKAAGGGDFSKIDAFPRGVVIDGFRLVTSHAAVTRIARAAAESNNPFEDIYAMAGTR
jgi:hypothetical protein